MSSKVIHLPEQKSLAPPATVYLYRPKGVSSAMVCCVELEDTVQREALAEKLELLARELRKS